jgi:hypothetical protein
MAALAWPPSVAASALVCALLLYATFGFWSSAVNDAGSVGTNTNVTHVSFEHQQAYLDVNDACTPAGSALNFTTGAAILPQRLGDPHAQDLSPVAPELTTLLHEESERLLREVLPRARSPACQQLIKERASHIRHAFERSFPRHELAERACPIDLLAQHKDAAQSNMPWEAQQPREPLCGTAAAGDDSKVGHVVKTEATLAFSILLSHSTSLMQLERLLAKIVRPQHVYHFSIDAQPAVRNRHGVSLNDLLGNTIERIMSRLGPVAYMNVSSSVDVVYTGPSTMGAYIMSWRALLREEVPPWDFLINISPSDYPIKSVEYMSRVLAESGPVSHTESFLQLPTYANGRSLRSWFIECPSEPCDGHDAPKWNPEPFRDPEGDKVAENSDEEHAESDTSVDPASDAKDQPEHSTVTNGGPARCAKRRSARGRDMSTTTVSSSRSSSSSSSSSSPCSGYVFWLPSARKPAMEKSREFGGSAFATLHHSFVHYTFNCLIGNDIGASTGRHGHQSKCASDGGASGTSSRQLNAERMASDVAYCKSIRGMYRWFATSFAAEETFVQTALFNGPFCHKTQAGNQRWVAWSGGDKDCGRGQDNPLDSAYNQNDYQSRRPTCITAQLAKEAFSPPPQRPHRARSSRKHYCSPCDASCAPTASLRNQLFARKFHHQSHGDAYDAADAAAGQWDELCVHDSQNEYSAI